MPEKLEGLKVGDLVEINVWGIQEVYGISEGGIYHGPRNPRRRDIFAKFTHFKELDIRRYEHEL